MGKKGPKRAEPLRQVLEDEIASGQLPPGLRLEEVALAKRFGVSRTPIREALQVLSSSGLVELRPRRGAVVASISLERLLEMFEVMAEMESLCGRLAARRMDGDERQALQKQNQACDDACMSGKIDTYYKANTIFHDTIYTGAHNRFLADDVRRLRDRLDVYRRLQLRLRDRMQASNLEHAAVTEAIIQGDENAAANLLRRHVSVQGDCFGDWISSLKAASLVTGGATA